MALKRMALKRMALKQQHWHLFPDVLASLLTNINQSRFPTIIDPEIIKIMLVVCLQKSVARMK